MKIYILFVICGQSVSNVVVETDIVVFAKKAEANSLGFGTRIVQIWENGKMVDSLLWEDFKNKLIKYL